MCGFKLVAQQDKAWLSIGLQKKETRARVLLVGLSNVRREDALEFVNGSLRGLGLVNSDNGLGVEFSSQHNAQVEVAVAPMLASSPPLGLNGSAFASSIEGY